MASVTYMLKRKTMKMKIRTKKKQKMKTNMKSEWRY